MVNNATVNKPKVNKTRVNLKLKDATHRAFKIWCFHHGVSLQAGIELVLEHTLKNKPVPPVPPGAQLPGLGIAPAVRGVAGAPVAAAGKPQVQVDASAEEDDGEDDLTDEEQAWAEQAAKIMGVPAPTRKAGAA